MSITIKNIEELKKFVKSLKLSEKQVLGLSGPMGAGKTEFTKCLLNILGGEAASSPTFSLHNRYEKGSRPVDHFDLYRLKNDEDLESSGFWDCFEQDSGLIVIEWADRIDKDYYPAGWDYCFIDFSVDEKTSHRRLSLSHFSK
ncbi:MAG: tRNA (adenosine(37)-N6)-threonylcarbamoyltransferase complex ATPase subunit type 1 TsaE [Bdellovibrionales bacterium]|nr:tRNA (adenosine(37)-N6)-threonylcarbamoyltransferase complex ATPase subunit type 1 TsaE [Bdellovibrionales bacterium]